MLYDKEDFDKLIKGKDCITCDILKIWYGTDGVKLDLLVGAIATGYIGIRSYIIPGSDDYLFDIPPEVFLPSNFTDRVNQIKGGLEGHWFAVDGPMFRSWFKRANQEGSSNHHSVTEYDVIYECSDALYPSGRDDNEYNWKTEKGRILDWLNKKVAITDCKTGDKHDLNKLKNDRLKERLIYAINPAKNPHKRKTFKFKK